MSYYVLLASATTVIGWLTWRIWRKTHEVSFVIGFLLIYYWTLYGGWWIVTDQRSGSTAARYYYLYDKLFPIWLDQYYFFTLLLYAVFVIAIAITVLMIVRDPAEADPPATVLVISHPLIIGMCAVAALVSYVIVRDAIQSSVELGQSAYAVTRSGDLNLFTLHQVLNRAALLPVAVGLAVALSGKNPKWIAGHLNQFHVVGYLLLLAGMYVFCAILGNKNELFASLLAGVLFYLANARRRRVWVLSIGAVLAFVLIGAVDWVRGLPIASVWEELNWSDFHTRLIEIASSNEAFGAHFSLYGVLRFEVPLTGGTSFISLIASIVPRVLWPNRPVDVYPYYAESVQAVGGQGYSIHHAAGWYLNFGWVGVLLGGVVWGGLWATLFNRFHRGHSMDGARRLFTILAPSMFVAGIPALIRTGIEGYKGLVVDSFLVPTIVFAVTQAAARSLTEYVLPASTGRSDRRRTAIASVAPRIT